MKKSRKSAAIANAQVDLANLKSIDSELDFGNNLSIAAVAQLLEDTQAEIETLNQTLNAITQARKSIRLKERALKKLIDRLHHGIALRYGKDSDEYRLIRPTVKRRKPITPDAPIDPNNNPSVPPQN